MFGCRCEQQPCEVHGITTSTNFMVVPINEIVVNDDGEHIPEGEFPK